MVVYCLNCGSENVELSNCEKYMACNNCEERVYIEDLEIGIIEEEQIEIKLECSERIEMMLALENRLDILENGIEYIQNLKYKSERNKIELEVLKEKEKRVNELYFKIYSKKQRENI